MVKISFIHSMTFFQLYYEAPTDDKSSVVQVLDLCYIGNEVVPEPMVTYDVILQATKASLDLNRLLSLYDNKCYTKIYGSPGLAKTS